MAQLFLFLLSLTLAGPGHAATSATFASNNSSVELRLTGADAKTFYTLLRDAPEDSNGRYLKTSNYIAFTLVRVIYSCSATRTDGTDAQCTIKLVDGPNALINKTKKLASYSLLEDVEAKKMLPHFAIPAGTTNVFTSSDKKLALRFGWVGKNEAHLFTLRFKDR